MLDKDVLPELLEVPVPTPDEIVRVAFSGVLLSLPSRVKLPPLLLVGEAPSFAPESSVKLPPLLVDGEPTVIDMSPPEVSPEESPVNVPPLPSTETAVVLLPSPGPVVGIVVEG